MKLKYLKNVSTLTLESDKCIGCGKCEEVCPHAVFETADNKAFIADINSCMECGACALNCPTGAIKVNAGVGCALAIIMGWFTGKEPSCGCAADESECC
jgi:NAD-dependent dihydropyrimidine dehydrogenase PreA subunit